MISLSARLIGAHFIKFVVPSYWYLHEPISADCNPDGARKPYEKPGKSEGQKIVKIFGWILVSLLSILSIWANANTLTTTFVMDADGKLNIVGKKTNKREIVEAYVLQDTMVLAKLEDILFIDGRGSPCSRILADACLYKTKEMIDPVAPIIFKSNFLPRKWSVLTIDKQNKLYGWGNKKTNSPLDDFASKYKIRNLKLVDLDNDGFDDFVFNQYEIDGCLHIFKGAKSGLPEKEVYKNCGLKFGESIVFFDIDGDGYQDILGLSYERNILLKNDGGMKFLDVTPPELIMSMKRPPVEGAILARLDESGDVIALVSNIAYNLSKKKVVDVDKNYEAGDEGIVFSDLENKGAVNIIKLNNSTTPNSLDFYEFKNNRIIFIKKIPLIRKNGIGLISVFGIDIADLNHDGCDDIVVSGGYPLGSGPAILFGDCRLSFDMVSLPGVPYQIGGPIMGSDLSNGSTDILMQSTAHNVTYDAYLQKIPKSSIQGELGDEGGNQLIIYRGSGLARPNVRLNIGKTVLPGHFFDLVGGTSKFQKRIWVANGSGYLNQKGRVVNVNIPWGECPFKIKYENGMSEILSCNTASMQQIQ